MKALYIYVFFITGNFHKTCVFLSAIGECFGPICAFLAGFIATYIKVSPARITDIQIVEISKTLIQKSLSFLQILMSWALQCITIRSVSAALSWEERGLVSPTAAGNRAQYYRPHYNRNHLRTHTFLCVGLKRSKTEVFQKRSEERILLKAKDSRFCVDG